METLFASLSIPQTYSPYATLEYKDIVLMELLAKTDGDWVRFFASYLAFLNEYNLEEYKVYQSKFEEYQAKFQ